MNNQKESSRGAVGGVTTFMAKSEHNTWQEQRRYNHRLLHRFGSPAMKK